MDLFCLFCLYKYQLYHSFKAYFILYGISEWLWMVLQNWLVLLLCKHRSYHQVLLQLYYKLKVDRSIIQEFFSVYYLPSLLSLCNHLESNTLSFFLCNTFSLKRWIWEDGKKFLKGELFSLSCFPWLWPPSLFEGLFFRILTAWFLWVTSCKGN